MRKQCGLSHFSMSAYLRVSTARQGQSGLGLEAQRKAVEDYLNGGHWQLIQEFVEVESGKNNDRAELAKAMALCRLRNATLVIAKIDRLSRDAHFPLGLPTISLNSLGEASPPSAATSRQSTASRRPRNPEMPLVCLDETSKRARRDSNS